MTTLADVFVRVRPETKEFGPELKRDLGKGGAARAVDQAGQKAGHDFSTGFGRGTKRLVGLAAGAFAGIKVKNFLVESTQRYREHTKAVAITTQVIKTTGGAAKTTAAQVGTLSDAIERKTGVDGDAIQSGANLLLTFTNVRNEVGKGNDIFNQSTAMLADMSVALKQDASSSAIQLGKALNDPVKGVTALSKVGVSFTEQQKKQIKTMVAAGNTLGAQKIILAELSKEFGGAAAAAADPADRARVAYRQLQDQIGSVTLPIVNQLSAAFADRLAPVLIDMAEKHGPKVTAFLQGLGPKLDGSLALLTTGDFNGKIRQALGGLKEDSGYVTTLLRIREGLVGLHGVFHLLATGDFAGRIFGQGEDSRFVDFLFDVREGIAKMWASIKTMDTDELKEMFFSAADSAGKLLPLVVEFIQQMPGLKDIVGGAVSVLGFLADHADTLRTLLPYLVAGLLAYKAAQAAANLAALLGIPMKIAEVVVNRQLVKSNRELIASRAGATVAQITGTAATGASTVATGANTVATSANATATIRQRIATLASATATKAVAAATAIWTGAQWLLNVALTANPIGLVIVAAALLAAGFVILWRRSETFRTIVTASLNAFRSVALTVIPFVWNLISGFFENLLDGAAHAFGWVPNLGPKLKAAAAWFGEFRDSVNTKLDGLKDQSITIKPVFDKNTMSLASAGRRAAGGPGGPVHGPGTPTSDQAGLYALSNEEWVIRAKASQMYGDYAMASVNAGTATIIPGRFAAGGSPGFSVRTPTPNTSQFAREVAAHSVQIAKPFAQQIANQLMTGPGGPPGARQSFRGVTLNERTIRMLLAAERILGAVFRITQGSYSTRVSASGSTHAGGGAMDTNGPRSWSSAVAALRQAGFAAWHRTPSQGPWGHHIHSIAIGDPSASPAAQGQVRDFQRGGDGLRGMAAGGRAGFLRQLGIKTFDGGGRWPTGTLGANFSGGTETVLTAEEAAARRSGRVEMTITNWKTGEGYFRTVAQDEIGGSREFESTARRMRG